MTGKGRADGVSVKESERTDIVGDYDEEGDERHQQTVLGSRDNSLMTLNIQIPPTTKETGTKAKNKRKRKMQTSSSRPHLNTTIAEFHCLNDNGMIRVNEPYGHCSLGETALCLSAPLCNYKLHFGLHSFATAYLQTLHL